MCIVVDTNTLGSVFEVTNANHQEFAPVYQWIVNGKGKVVFGGSRYTKELGKYLPLFVRLNRAKKAVYVDDSLVDAEEAKLTAMISHPDFDDPHLVALLRVSKCKLICSLDSRAYPYFRHNQFFSPASVKPKIYSSLRNKGLLSDQHIAEICKPCDPTTKAQMLQLGI